ncbi:Hpt domain-containing protein [Celeribacter arenosi]|uniref:Hpt domain-containing protein n=1 Tax=Celeribacter arenosi TaxID=792649 RepID=A0ABP7JXA6_9RHOB
MIDWDRIDILRSEVGPEDFGEVVELFLEEVDEVIAAMRDKTNTMTLAETMHFLKGSSLNLGFATFSSLCRGAEIMLAAGQADEIDMDEIIDCYDASRQTFLEHVERAA